VYNLLQPASADEIGRRKADLVAAAGAELLASANPGCTLQIGKLLRERGIVLPARHPIELLDASLRGDRSLVRRAG
jgi:glycolate oxidase iron-sulfur subunit